MRLNIFFMTRSTQPGRSNGFSFAAQLGVRGPGTLPHGQLLAYEAASDNSTSRAELSTLS